MKRYSKTKLCTGLGFAVISLPALAHDPNFGLGPHVLFKGGVEMAAELHKKEAGDEKESELGLKATYGITGDWAAGFEVPYAIKDNGDKSSNGLADVQLFTKYRFWRKDSLGLQESAAVMFAANFDNGDEKNEPPLGNGATDITGGLTYGYESIKWYRWASVRYRLNGENDADLQKGNKVLVDFVGGWRPIPPEYTKPDTVWLLELNGEYDGKAERKGNKIADSGGAEWFISPGIFWTKRNFAIKAGVQLPVYSDLNGNQNKSDYRAKMTFEWHM